MATSAESAVPACGSASDGAGCVRHAARNLGNGLKALMILLLAGCATPLVHDENRDKQAQEARKRAMEARVSDAVSSLEKHFADVAAIEESRIRDRAAHLFEQELRVAARAGTLTSRFDHEARTKDGLLTAARNRLEALGMAVDGQQDLKRLRSLAPQLAARQRALQVDMIVFHGTVGHRFESCKSVYQASSDPKSKSEIASKAFLDGIPAERRETARIKYPGLVEACGKVEQTEAERSKAYAGGMVKEALGDLDRVRQQVLRYEEEVKAARAEMEIARRSLQGSGAAAPLAPADAGRGGSPESRVRRLASALARVTAVGKAHGESGSHAIAVERLSRLEEMLKLIAGSPPDASVKLSPEEQFAAAVVREIPGLASEADKMLAEARRPRLVPFVVALEQQKLVVQGFEARMHAKRKQLAALQGRLDAMLNETDSLLRVYHVLGGRADWATRSLGNLLGELEGPEKLVLLRALAEYADEVQQYRAEGDVWRIRAIAAGYEEGLVQSKYAAAQWDALIDGMATVLADYHAAGIRKADLAEFFKALGLVVVGVGAAQ